MSFGNVHLNQFFIATQSTQKLFKFVYKLPDIEGPCEIDIRIRNLSEPGMTRWTNALSFSPALKPYFTILSDESFTFEVECNITDQRTQLSRYDRSIIDKSSNIFDSFTSVVAKCTGRAIPEKY